MVKIRPLQIDDREHIYIILQQTDMFTPAEIEVAMELIDIYLFDKFQKDYLIHVAVNPQQEVLGYICYGHTPATEGTYYIYWIVVSSAHQHQGIGKRLMKFAENEIRRKEGRLIVLETSSQQKYESTRFFYEHRGYQLSARIKDFYRLGDDRLIYTKYLNQKQEEAIFKNGKVAEDIEG